MQIAKAFGAVVIATAGSTRKLEIAKGFGADYAINYNKQGWEEEIRKLTPKGKGVDIVYDPVGMVNTSLKCTAWNGRIVIVGFAGGAIEKVALNRVLLKNVSLVGLHWGMFAQEEPKTAEEVWRGLFGLIEAEEFRATVYTDGRFVGLGQRRESNWGCWAGGRRGGKVVVSVASGWRKQAIEQCHKCLFGVIQQFKFRPPPRSPKKRRSIDHCTIKMAFLLRTLHELQIVRERGGAEEELRY